MKHAISFLLLLIIVTLSSFQTQKKDADISIQIEKYKLPNGLTVVLNVDKSDPIADPVGKSRGKQDSLIFSNT